MSNDPDIKKMKADLDAIEDLLQNAPPPEAPHLELETLDVSTWTELGDFFDRPDVRSTLFQRFEEVNDGIESEDGWMEKHVQVIYPCCFLIHSSTDRNKAVAALRAELKKVQDAGGESVGFLTRPSVIQLVRPAKEGETPDIETLIDLGGPRPGKKYYAAFCFLFGYFRTSGEHLISCPELERSVHSQVFNLENMRLRQLTGAHQEGQIPATKD